MTFQPATAAEMQDRISKLETDIEWLSRRDQLTGLFNRVAFLAEVDNHLLSKNGPNRGGAMVEIVVRGVPRISGTLGRHVADYVISSLAARLNRMLLPTNTTARIDHNHFAILLHDINDPLEALTLAKEILANLSQSVDWLDRHLNVELAAGVALATDNEGDGANFLHNAELALKSATTRGGPAYAFFNPALAQGAKRRNDVLLALQSCIEKNQLSLSYQPVFDSKTRQLAGFEALLRFYTPELGSVPPGEFIPVAEEAGLIDRIGTWALAEACNAASAWPSNLIVAVNISPEQFYSGSLVTVVHNALEMASFPAYRLELEITEGVFLKDSDAVLSQLSTLREMGCSIALDDFGIGYSSLSYLWKFPFSKLKIDRAFVSALDSTVVAKGVLQSIIGLAENLGLKITAEGIETEAQAKALTDLGANYLQGFHLGYPTKVADLPGLMMKAVSGRFPEAANSDQLNMVAKFAG